ncbi:lovastatin nonaketide synthase [Apiospora phragmitis]|uniref:Lovastatin nonaketide synthase n=1 Tax=Apiospora phragmitis TaxID=2905665 RepID=A0ABR1WTG5_9PEZI
MWQCRPQAVRFFKRAPKTVGSKNVDAMFRGQHEDEGSFAVMDGHPGQANYAAANMYMNGLATRRRLRQDCAGSVLNIGVIYGLGLLQRERASSSDMMIFVDIAKPEWYYRFSRDTSEAFLVEWLSKNTCLDRPMKGLVNRLNRDDEAHGGARRLMDHTVYRKPFCVRPKPMKTVLLPSETQARKAVHNTRAK